jgi:hypothetical protein
VRLWQIVAGLWVGAAVVVVSLGLWARADRARAAQRDAAAVRARGLTFAPDVPAADRQWILAAEAAARPEAQPLLDAVDGMTYVSVFSAPGAWLDGVAQTVGPHRYHVALNVAKLDGDRRVDRDVVVIHELGHVIDFELVPDALRDRLAAEVPARGTCMGGDWDGDCANPKEKFADTFAKWALRGRFSDYGAGYGLLTPASLEDWGRPLAALAVQVSVS